VLGLLADLPRKDCWTIEERFQTGKGLVGLDQYQVRRWRSWYRRTVMYGARDVRVEQRPDATVRQPTDAVVRVVRSAICGSDLWAYGSMPASQPGRPMGHEFLGVVEDVGTEVTGLKRGDLVVTPSSGPTTPATSAPRASTRRAATAAATA
jgi:NADPH:quinone reductase-like Zn-dependent oxidoreductase